ncbi:four helix bundle protein [Daejeonella sp.]|uniref:four helix bundle protein n=1 Tax=Daejeonella sp. TaxID=2805397 RepID=UPI0030BB8898
MASKIPLHDNIIVEKTFLFAVQILKLSPILQENKQFVLANQLLRSGMSIGANTREAQNAESKADFIHKFKIAAKEADEAEYWLLLTNEVLKDSIIPQLLEELKIIQKIITKIIATTKNQLAKNT